MSLKVKKILHVERSLYQNVLVFEFVAHDNILVLDGVIQCTERDEFSCVHFLLVGELAECAADTKKLFPTFLWRVILVRAKLWSLVGAMVA